MCFVLVTFDVIQKVQSILCFLYDTRCFVLEIGLEYGIRTYKTVDVTSRIEKGSKAQLVWRDQSSLDIKTCSTFQDMFNIFTKAYRKIVWILHFFL